MIIEPVIIGTAKRIECKEEYYYCTYNNNKVICKYQDTPVVGKTFTIDNIFAELTLEALDHEITERCLVRIVDTEQA